VHLLVRHDVPELGGLGLAHDHVVPDLVAVLHEDPEEPRVPRVLLDAEHDAVGGDVQVPQQHGGLVLDKR